MTRSADPAFREQAIALRRAGKSLREIKEALGPVGNDTLNAALRGTPPADATRRPNAKDDLRERARQLRTDGRSYNEIAAQLGVAKSSVSLWVRDLPLPPKFQHADRTSLPGRSPTGARGLRASPTAVPAGSPSSTAIHAW